MFERDIGLYIEDMIEFCGKALCQHGLEHPTGLRWPWRCAHR